MSKKYRLIVFILVSLAVGALALNRSVDSARPTQQSDATPAEAGYVVPEHVVYRHLFHHAHVMNQEAQKAELRGNVQAASSLRSFYKHEAELNDEQARIFDQVAAECEREVNEQDRRAQIIIKKFRAQFPGGRVPDGEPLPPPSPELAQMQTERNAIILRARDRLHEALGEEEFSRFQRFVKVRVAPNIHPMSPEQLASVTESETR
jgi:hypothetical protein